MITTQSGGIPEIIRNNENGYLVERNNENELGNVIESVLNEYNSSKNVTMREQAVVDAKQYANIRKAKDESKSYFADVFIKEVENENRTN